MNPKLRFDKFMELALYHPQHGYYSSAIGKNIGRSGDFFTSVSVGDTFGLLLSHVIEKKWQRICPDGNNPLIIAEQGAHDGQLARDIIDALRLRDSPLYENMEYRIVEPRESIRRELLETVHGTLYSSRLYPVESLEQARAERGVFLCNELLDAFPVRRFTWKNGTWKDVCVSIDTEAGQLIESEEDVADGDGDLDRFLDLVGEDRDFPEGYVTEFCPGVKDWIGACSRIFEKSGSWIVIDYGFEAEQYFSELRTTGTLKCYRDHRTHDDALDLPGETDISAHVNLTDLIREAEKAGLPGGKLSDQARFLTRAAEDWLRAMEGQIPDAESAGRLRQFQTLTHPAMMGRSFQVVEFEK